MHLTRTFTASAGVLVLASAALAGAMGTGTANASARTSHGHHGNHGNHVKAKLNSLNNSGASGHARVRVNHRQIKVAINAHGLTKGMPHAQHIHYGAQARQECPTAADNTNRDFHLTTTEGAPAYGPIVVSLTTRGDTSPSSALDVSRFPTTPKGVEHYKRTTHTSKAVARAIKRGEAVVVIHGVDYNGNGKYDFDGAGKSELDPNLPAEATDPAVCGVLHR